MVAAVRVHKTGGPEVLTYEEVEVGEPGPGQLRVKQHAAGLNYIDTYFRSGLYPAPSMPFVAGNEGAGEVVAVGQGVSEFKVGDRVAYVAPMWGYAAERLVPAERAVKLPAQISYEQAAGMMLKGMTVQYLLNRTFKVQKGMTILIHAAAGGVGLIACQWANHLGANVIGTVGSKAKAALATENGCHHTILYRDEDFVARVKEITGGALCPVVYDGVGKDTFPGSLDCLRAARHVRELRQCVRSDRGVQPRHPVAEGLALRHAADAQHLHGQTRGPAQDRAGPVRRGDQGRGEDPDQPHLRAQGRSPGAPRPGRPQDHRLGDLEAVAGALRAK